MSTVPAKKSAAENSAQAALLGRVLDIVQAARTQAARSVNTAQVVANWLVGREIVEDEQQGKRRAGYGARVLAELSLRLTAALGRGYSVDSLEAFRQFYIDYPLLISETASRKFVASRVRPRWGIWNCIYSRGHRTCA